MVLPLLPALQEWLRPSDVAPLKIDESDALDPPGLAHGFAALPLELQALPPHLDRCRLMTVTAHRRENWGDGIQNFARAVARLLFQHDDLAVVWPVHGNRAVRDIVFAELGALAQRLGGRLTLCPPLDYPALLWCLRRSALALTGSGGIQEEGAALSVANNPAGLIDMTWLLPRSPYNLPVVTAGSGSVSVLDSTHWLVIARSGNNLSFSAAKR